MITLLAGNAFLGAVCSHFFSDFTRFSLSLHPRLIHYKCLQPVSGLVSACTILEQFAQLLLLLLQFAVFQAAVSHPPYLLLIFSIGLLHLVDHQARSALVNASHFLLVSLLTVELLQNSTDSLRQKPLNLVTKS